MLPATIEPLEFNNIFYHFYFLSAKLRRPVFVVRQGSYHYTNTVNSMFCIGRSSDFIVLEHRPRIQRKYCCVEANERGSFGFNLELTINYICFILNFILTVFLYHLCNSKSLVVGYIVQVYRSMPPNLRLSFIFDKHLVSTHKHRLERGTTCISPDTVAMKDKKNAKTQNRHYYFD